MRLSGPPPGVLPAQWPGPEERAARHGLIGGMQNSAHVCDDGSDDGLCPPASAPMPTCTFAGRPRSWTTSNSWQQGPSLKEAA